MLASPSPSTSTSTLTLSSSFPSSSASLSSSLASSAPSSPPSGGPPPLPSLSSLQVRLRVDRLAAKRNLEASPLWLDWRAAVERLQQLQSPPPSLLPTPSPASLSCTTIATASPSTPAAGSELSTPPTLSPASSPASSVSSVSTSSPSSSTSSSPSSSLLTPEVLLSLSDGFELLDDTDPVFVEQARLQRQLRQQKLVEALKAELMRSAEWQALVKVNEQLRTAAKKETEGLRATLKGWTSAASTATPTPSPPLSAVESPAPRASRPLPPPLSLSFPDDAAQHDSPHASPPHTTRALAADSSASASVLLSPPTVLSAALRPVAVHSQPPWPASFVPASAASYAALGLPMGLAPAQSNGALMRHSPHPAQSPPIPLMPPQHGMPLLASPFTAPRTSAFSPASAFSSVKPRPLDPHSSPALPHPPLHHTVHLATPAGVQPARVAGPSSTSGRHAAGDPSRLRSPSWCSGLIEDPHQVVPEHGLGLTSHDVHVQMCGTEKHQLQRLWARQDGHSALSALLRALHFDVERNFDHPPPSLVDQLRRELRRAVEAWSDQRFAAALPRHLRGLSRADFLAKQLSPSAASLDPALLWVWKAATHKAPRIYLITVALPVKAKVKEEQGVAEAGDATATPTPTQSNPTPPLHSLRLQILGEADPLPSTPCILLYQNLCGPLPHHEALAWKKGTRGPSRLKTVHAYHEPIIGALEAWYRARQHLKAMSRKRKRVVGGGGGVGREGDGVEVEGGAVKRLNGVSAERVSEAGGGDAGVMGVADGAGGVRSAVSALGESGIGVSAVAVMGGA